MTSKTQPPASADDIDATRFTSVRVREGYDMAEVDTVLDRVADAFRGHGDMTGEELRGTRFTPTRWREGYDMAEVDAFLDVTAAALDNRRTPPTGSEPDQPSTTSPCAICFALVRNADEDAHRTWHVQMLAR